MVDGSVRMAGCCCEWLLARKLSVADEHSDMIDADSRNSFSLFGAGDLIELGQHGHALQLAWRSSCLRSGRRQASAHASKPMAEPSPHSRWMLPLATLTHAHYDPTFPPLHFRCAENGGFPRF